MTGSAASWKALTRLLETERDTRKDRDLAALETRLARALRRVWRAQERDLLARITRNRALWFLNEAAVGEAVPPEGFDSMWDAVEDATTGPMADAVRDAADTAATRGGRSAQTDLGLAVDFALVNPAALDWLRRYAADRVAGLNATTRAQLRTLLVQAAAEGWSYQRTSREIRAKFRGFHTPDPRLHIRDRAELVAVTEIGEAYEHGRWMVVDDLQARGQTVEKRWLTAADDRVCEICAPNGAAGWVAAERSFPSGHNRPLGHPACRCDLLARTVPIPALVPALA